MLLFKYFGFESLEFVSYFDIQISDLNILYFHYITLFCIIQGALFVIFVLTFA
jgi:hypothetical protein